MTNSFRGHSDWNENVQLGQLEGEVYILCPRGLQTSAKSAGTFVISSWSIPRCFNNSEHFSGYFVKYSITWMSPNAVQLATLFKTSRENIAKIFFAKGLFTNCYSKYTSLPELWWLTRARTCLWRHFYVTWAVARTCQSIFCDVILPIDTFSSPFSFVEK